MSLMPGVEHDIVAGGRDDNDRMLMTRWDIVCGHTMVGFFPAHAAHFSVRADGYIKQSRNTKNRSAANYQGNHRVIAIENEDHGEPEFKPWNTADGHAVPALTPEQCESNAEIIAWAYHEHGIPIESCINSKPTSRGVGYHRMGCDSDNNFAGYDYPGRVAGGELWTIHKGKVCPGDRRIWQYLNVIIPRARVLAGLEEDDMLDDDERNALFSLFKAVFFNNKNSPFPPDGTQGDQSMIERLVELQQNIRILISRPVADIDEAALALELDKLGVGGANAAQVKQAVIEVLRGGTEQASQ